MTRTSRFKLLYLVELTTLGVLCGTIVYLMPAEKRGMGMLVMAALLFMPGRIQGWLLRNHFVGRRLADQGRSEDSMAESEAFLRQVTSEPWRKKAIWLAGVVYSPDIEPMPWNNLGIAALHAGEYAKAEGSFRQALAVDPQYPIPHANLAVLASIRGQDAAVSEHLADAMRLGYHGMMSDQAIRQAQRVLAAVEGARKAPRL